MGISGAAALSYLQAGAAVVSAGAAIHAATQKPKLPGAKPMPMPDDDAILQAKRRKAVEMQTRSGRASTILTASTDKLGG